MSFTTKTFLLIILSSAIFNLETTEASLHLTAEVDQLNYNVGEGATFTCTINSDEFIAFGLEIEWYKQQDDEFVLVGRYQNIILPPFEDTKYVLSAPTHPPRTKKISFILQITNVEAVDIGNYKCASGYTGEAKNDSNTVELLVNPDVQSTSLDLTTTAPNVDDSYLFNSSYSITCEGVAPSTSTTLGLTVRTQDDTEITQDFELTINKEWVGNVEGLKSPLVTYKLEAMDWSLEASKSDEIFCYFQDGDRLLHSKSIEVYKMEDEPVVNCTSNYKQRAVEADDEDVYITCRVYKYTGSLENTELSWNFVNEETGQNSTLVAGDSTDPQRIVKAKNGEYILVIPRVSHQMVSTGKVFPYTVKFYTINEDKSITDIASTQYNLMQDGTRPYTGNHGNRYSISACLQILILTVFIFNFQV